ncbi:aldolase II superfamily protein [Pseudomonas putida S11]|nr:aldolase II superfamily protein [Pseudomonas putida S11]
MMTTTEQSLRQELAACYRLIAHFRMSDLIFTHISLRLPGPEHHFLINPYGLLFDEITASSLVKIDLQGRPVEATPHPVNPAGFVIHSAIHAAREDARCVLHTHTRGRLCGGGAGMWAATAQPDVHGVLLARWHTTPMKGVALDMDEQRRLVADLGDKPVMILRNHGLLTTGRSVAEAFLRMYYLEKACEIQLAAQSAGQVILPPAEVCAHTERQFNEPGRGLKQGELADPDALQLAWAALLRMLEKVAPGYRS